MFPHQDPDSQCPCPESVIGGELIRSLTEPSPLVERDESHLEGRKKEVGEKKSGAAGEGESQSSETLQHGP